MEKKLDRKLVVTGLIRLESGLLIGASNSALTIGDVNKVVVRDPITQQPYIPGSSLKGKMRSLLEILDGTVGVDGLVSNDPNERTSKIFGYAGKSKGSENQVQQPSLLVFRDCKMTDESVMKLADTELYLTEVKAENSINRITAMANPRFFERVPAGAEFSFEIIASVYDGNNKETNEAYTDAKKLLETLAQGMRLLQDDYLGMGGSRGNGQISFHDIKVSERDSNYYEKGTDEKAFATEVFQEFLK